jgi:hypothetical protein
MDIGLWNFQMALIEEVAHDPVGKQHLLLLEPVSIWAFFIQNRPPYMFHLLV